jgi:flagellar basal-body rod protein FlgF
VTDFRSLLLTQVYKDKPGAEVGTAGTGVSLSSVVTNFESGRLKLTDHPFDFAVAGDGFFQVQTPDGVRYTRGGRFHRDTSGPLINDNGYPVLGRNGQITLPEGLVAVNPRGEIFVDEMYIGDLSLAQFENTDDIIKENETLFSGRDGVQPEILSLAETKVYQGYLEDSNVDSAQAMTEMMSVLRTYQASQRMVQLPDGTRTYTRDGGFQLDGEGRLVTHKGYVFMPEIILPPNAEETLINGNGEVMVHRTGELEPQVIGTIELARFANVQGLESAARICMLPPTPPGRHRLDRPGPKVLAR